MSLRTQVGNVVRTVQVGLANHLGQQREVTQFVARANLTTINGSITLIPDSLLASNQRAFITKVSLVAFEARWNGGNFVNVVDTASTNTLFLAVPNSAFDANRSIGYETSGVTLGGGVWGGSANGRGIRTSVGGVFSSGGTAQITIQGYIV